MINKVVPIALLLMLVSVDLLADTQTAIVRWSYPSGVVNLSGFKVYLGTSLVTIVSDPAARTCEFQLDSALVTKVISVSAYDSLGNESLLSKPYQVVFLKTPTNLKILSLP